LFEVEGNDIILSAHVCGTEGQIMLLEEYDDQLARVSPWTTKQHSAVSMLSHGLMFSRRE
jgi:hypothetical protein